MKRSYGVLTTMIIPSFPRRSLFITALLAGVIEVSKASTSAAPGYDDRTADQGIV
jgi:hypothetical protein